jgi:phage baseplate assembly protein V
MDLVNLARRLGLTALSNRLRLVVGRCTIHRANDASKVQTVQVELLKDEVRDGIERYQNYGFTSVPLPGMEGVAVFVGGDRSNGVVLAIGDRLYRLRDLQPGETAMYDDLGQKVHLTRAGIIAATPLNATVSADGDIDLTAGGKLRLVAPNIEIHATDSLRFDVAGHGQHWYPDKMDPWTIGAVAGTPHPITPPEIE